MLKIFDNFGHFQQSWQFLTIFNNLKICWQFLTILAILTILTFFYLQFWQFLTIDNNFDNSDNCFCHFDIWKDNPGDLWHLRHWLQFWQLRTWIHDNFVTWQLRVTLDSIRHSCDVLNLVNIISQPGWICRISAEEREMIMAGRSFDPKAQKEELETPTLPLVTFLADF